MSDHGAKRVDMALDIANATHQLSTAITKHTPLSIEEVRAIAGALSSAVHDLATLLDVFGNDLPTMIDISLDTSPAVTIAYTEFDISHELASLLAARIGQAGNELEEISS